MKCISFILKVHYCKCTHAKCRAKALIKSMNLNLKQEHEFGEAPLLHCETLDQTQQLHRDPVAIWLADLTERPPISVPVWFSCKCTKCSRKLITCADDLHTLFSQPEETYTWLHSRKWLWIFTHCTSSEWWLAGNLCHTKQNTWIESRKLTRSQFFWT